ncbi:MAG: 5-aminovalerate aminotransferase DavT [Acidimicrobiales bacterium]|nr:MAG: aminotransferase class III-fold pyridoxal phosphate-dependent enzyme [Actinomycetota bacterium]MBV6509343.1 5-aminovalerate aminotransferase DavT [Acidimicrobiales bacterium]RIK04620.1 MAG: aspartate aminotransferase family protein [Acidobacteriota bacterium]
MTEHVSEVYPRASDLEIRSARGCTVVATDGTEYLDLTSGIAVTATGHSHPRVVEAIANQAAEVMHAQVYLYRHPMLGKLAKRLSEVAPPGIDTFFFANSGAEAVEAAVKLCRQVTGRPNIVVFEGSFHGRTAMTMAMTTSKTAYRAGYQPLPSGVFVAPFPQVFENGGSEQAEVERCLEQLRRLLLRQTAPEETAAMVIEPVLGEGGYLPAPKDFLLGVQEICRRHGIVFVLDEVQSGFARTGRFFALEHSGLEPDVVIMAKGMGSGFPISAIGAPKELMDRWPTGSHGGTYGGNPLGCAAALATIDVIEDERLVENAAERGAQLVGLLKELQRRHAGLADIRGYGLMIGCELLDPRGEPDGARVGEILRYCRADEHVLLMACGHLGNVVRWMPPLVVSSDEIARGVEAFGRALIATEPQEGW